VAVAVALVERRARGLWPLVAHLVWGAVALEELALGWLAVVAA